VSVALDSLPKLGDQLALRRDWRARAACRGEPISVFFPLTEGDYAPAKVLCGGCPVRQECLETALADLGCKGYWGGTNERTRQKMRLRAG
jgi:WhiB family redox-sensing transcriptional regulator